MSLEPLLKLLILSLIALLLFGGGIKTFQAEKNALTSAYEPRSAILIQHNTLKAIAPLYLIEEEKEEDGIQLIVIRGNSIIAVSELLTPKDKALLILLEMIIERESGGDPEICNLDYGCKAGMGLTGLIPSTVKYCEDKLERELDPFDPFDNKACAMWLLENEGIRHWEEWSGPYPSLESLMN